MNKNDGRRTEKLSSAVPLPASEGGAKLGRGGRGVTDVEAKILFTAVTFETIFPNSKIASHFPRRRNGGCGLPARLDRSAILLHTSAKMVFCTFCSPCAPCGRCQFSRRAPTSGGNFGTSPGLRIPIVLYANCHLGKSLKVLVKTSAHCASVREYMTPNFLRL